MSADNADRYGEKTAPLHLVRPVPYRPSNGTEGDAFFARWCALCAHDSPDEPCRILAATMFFEVDDVRYPREWRYDEGGEPCCTAYLSPTDALAPPRCPLTIDMFEESA